MKILIVGAGPVGMILAILLQQKGIKDISVIDKRANLSELPRGIAINQNSLAILEKTGVLSDVLQIGVRVSRLNIYKDKIKRGDVTFKDLHLNHSYFFHVRQSDVERILARKLQDSGINILVGHTLSALQQESDHINASIETNDGRYVVNSADLVVGCDGGNGACSRLSGINITQESYGGYFQLADVVLSDTHYSPQETHYFLSREGYLMLVPAPRGETRVIASFPGKLSPSAKETTNRVFEQLIKERTGYAPKVTQLIWSTRSIFGHKVSGQAKAGRVVLAGDALHQFSPIGGTNMNVGMADAEALAEAIQTGSIDDYAKQRQLVISKQIAFTKYLTYLMVRPKGMARPESPFSSSTLSTLLQNELPPLMTGFSIPLAQMSNSFPKVIN